MGALVRIERRGDDRLLAVKRARPGAEQALAQEAALLATLRMPGVVELVDDLGPRPEPDHDRPDEPPVLVTRWVGPRTAADLDRPLTPERAAGLCVAVAATVARLHRAGVVHGAIELSHVVLDAEGRPVLCGFGAAGPIDGARRPADDVAGLGRFLADLLTPDGAADDQVPTVRRADRGRQRALLSAARQAGADDPSHRPSVAAFVHSVRRAVPEARLDQATPPRPRRSDADPPAPEPTRRPSQGDLPDLPARSDLPARGARRARHASTSDPSGSRARAALGVAAVTVAGATAYFGLTAWSAPSVEQSAQLATGTVATTASSPAPDDGAAPTTGRRPTSSSSTSTATSTAGAPTTSPPASLPGAAPVVEHLGRRYQVGEPGDVAAVGPWLCDGNDLVAVLRPSTGVVHVFSTWASELGTVDARTVTSVPGASSLQRVADGPGCAVLVVGSGAAPLRTLTAEDLR